MSSSDAAAVTGDNAKMITLKSSNGEMFELEETVALQSQTIKHIIEDDCVDSAIPLPNVTSRTLVKVIEYCKRHVEGQKEDELKTFNDGFVKEVDRNMLFDLVLAANYLDIKSLLDLTCQTIADMIKDMSVEEVRTLFNIKNDFTEEEEAKIRSENAWAFD